MRDVVSMYKHLLLVTVSLCLLSVGAFAEDGSDENFARFARHGADVWARNPVAPT